MTRCTCGGLGACRYCEAFDAWESGLSDAERGALALRFVEGLTAAHGVVRGEVRSRAPWSGHAATVEFNGAAAFGDFLADTFRARCAADLRVAA